MIHLNNEPSSKEEPGNEIELVERKGLGHPDTLCDLVAEQASQALCRLYLNESGRIQHHNIDKALLIAGNARPAFKGGKVLAPMQLIMAGRATDKVNGKQLPVAETIRQAATNALKNALRHINPEKHFTIAVQTQPGSGELQALTEREVPLANDTSIGVGFYPLTSLENLVKQASAILNRNETLQQFPFLGEDVKVMGMRRGAHYHLTIGAALIGRYLDNLQAYKDAITAIEAHLKDQLSQGYPDLEVTINAADDYAGGDVYLTVNGTSAEMGDDGQVGRGNRCNGLITPYRPMSMEAVAGKNPFNHVGKHYNLMAREMSRSIVEENLAEEAQVYMVSRIGAPITEPELVDVKLTNYAGNEQQIRDLVNTKLGQMDTLWKQILEGNLSTGI